MDLGLAQFRLKITSLEYIIIAKHNNNKSVSIIAK